MRKELRIFTIGAVIVAVVFVCSTCDDKTTVEPTALPFTGFVIDSLTSEPMESVLVSIHDTSWITTYSDSMGFFEGVTIRTVATVFARRENYRTKWLIRDLTKDTTDRLFFELAPTNSR